MVLQRGSDKDEAVERPGLDLLRLLKKEQPETSRTGSSEER